jgi:hypothetical protein
LKSPYIFPFFQAEPGYAQGSVPPFTLQGEFEGLLDRGGKHGGSGLGKEYNWRSWEANHDPLLHWNSRKCRPNPGSGRFATEPEGCSPFRPPDRNRLPSDLDRLLFATGIGIWEPRDPLLASSREARSRQYPFPAVSPRHHVLKRSWALNADAARHAPKVKSKLPTVPISRDDGGHGLLDGGRPAACGGVTTKYVC